MYGGMDAERSGALRNLTLLLFYHNDEVPGNFRDDDDNPRARTST